MRRCALLLLLVAVARCSPGDRQPEFQACVQQCTRSGCVGPECVASCAGGDPSSLGNLQLLRWDCTADCRYRCMQARELAGSLKGLRPLKYDGKWPFERVLGVQEPASVLFSLTNLWAHCRGFTSLRAAMTRTYPLRTLWTGYALLSVNAWVWSSVFHCRDVRATEVLDYCSADALLVYTLFAVVVRARRLLRVHQWLPLAAPLTAALALHLRYMLFTLFDYGLNMKVRAAQDARRMPADPHDCAAVCCSGCSSVARAAVLDAGIAPSAAMAPARAGVRRARRFAAGAAGLPAPGGSAGRARAVARCHAGRDTRLVRLSGGGLQDILAAARRGPEARELESTTSTIRAGVAGPRAALHSTPGLAHTQR